MIPAAPLVGAVTMRPPAAFSSFTARANRLTHSIALKVEPITLGLPISCRLRCSFAARRCTFSPPGRMPSSLRPLPTQSCMACQIVFSPERISVSLRHMRSLASISSDTRRLCRRHSVSSSAALLKS
ncbi:hypothetical protein D3C78_1056980 [compost metagenome]